MEEQNKALEYFAKRLAEYEIVCSDEGKFYEVHGWVRVQENAIACMLRLDYLRDGIGVIRGKALNNLIQAFIGNTKVYLIASIHKPEFAHAVREKELG